VGTGPDYFKERPDADAPDYFQTKRADWKQHEKDIAKRSGGRQQPGSGNKPGRPGDVVDTLCLRDGKATRSGKSISVSASILATITGQALALGKIPVVEVRLESAEPPVPTDWVCLPAQDFQQLLERE